MTDVPNPTLFSSHRLELLVKQLYMQIEADRADLFDRPLIIIPHSYMKEWIQIECCKVSDKKGLLGWEFASWQQALPLVAGSLPVPKRSELEAAVWDFSLHSAPAEWRSFLSSDRKRLDLVTTCSNLFYDYLLYGLPEKSEGWQKEALEAILKVHGWVSFPEALKQAFIKRTTPLYLFAIDSMPPSVYQFYLHHPFVRLFRFSPTAMFWDDVRSPRERLSLLKQGKKRGGSPAQLSALEGMLRTEQPLLANWGVLGRKMIEVGADLPFDTLDNYEVDEQDTLLSSLRRELLTMEEGEKALDDSMQVIQTGPSRLREVEVLRDQILRLAEEGVRFSSMRVYAPDIGVYAPLIAFVFTDSIPFRIAGIDLARQSSYFQGLERLCSAVTGRWEAKEWMALLETKAFYQKQKWTSDDQARIKDWIVLARVRWGIDKTHQNEVTAETVETAALGMGTWERGFDRLLDLCVYFDPAQEEIFQWSEADLFQQFLSLFYTLRDTIASWKRERTLAEWVLELERLADTFLLAEDNEEDRAAKGAFSSAINSLREAGRCVPETQFPFSYIKHHLFMPSYCEQGAGLLEAVRCSSLELGTVLPSRALFLLGMDEESFPRSSPLSSLHLLRKEGVYLPQQADIDRYLFLQTLFAAQEKWICSYGHLSKEDGKAVSPSLLVQELLSYVKQPLLKSVPTLTIAPECFQKPFGSRSIGEYRAAVASQEKKSHSFLHTLSLVEPLSIPSTLSLATLRKWLRNPFQYYLEQTVGLERKEETESKWEEFENSPLIRHLFLKESLEEEPESVLEKWIRADKLPVGLLGEEAKRDLLQRAKDLRSRLVEWNIAPSSLRTISFKQNCSTPDEYPPIKVKVFGKEVELVGEVGLAVPSGALYLGDDSIGGVLKAWPELLASCIAANGSSLYSLRSGRERKVEEPLLALQALTELYVRCQETPLFLHPEWADSLLRKDVAIEREAEDRVLDWVLERSPTLNLEEERARWKPLLQSSFASLSALFPTRKGKGSHAEV